MPKLNQILAIEKQTKTNSYGEVTKLHQESQKTQLLSGITRTYKSNDDEGERFPSEEHHVQVRLPELIARVQELLTPWWDITLQRDQANTSAKADVVVDGVALLKEVPVTYLLWLEKQLNDAHTFITKLPSLPVDEVWELDEQQDCYRSKSVETAKTKKIPKPFVKAEATKEHPAQVDVVHEDIIQGYWTTTKFSGALPQRQIRDMRERCEKLLAAVKFAREQANMTEVPKVHAGEAVLSYLFGVKDQPS